MYKSSYVVKFKKEETVLVNDENVVVVNKQT